MAVELVVETADVRVDELAESLAVLMDALKVVHLDIVKVVLMAASME